MGNKAEITFESINTSMNFKQFLEVEDVAMQPLFFGCVGGDGHYVYTSEGHYVPRSTNLPAGKFLQQHDGQLVPKTATQGAAQIHHFPDFTVIAAHDFSIDSRPGSNAMFLIPGQHNDAEALAMGQKIFPQLWARVKPHVV
jgi:hypothetical protein